MNMFASEKNRKSQKKIEDINKTKMEILELKNTTEIKNSVDLLGDNIEKMLILPTPHRYIGNNEISIKIPVMVFADTDKIILNFICKGKGIRIPKTILKNRNKMRVYDIAM